jgi:hypothetical protein
MLNTSGPGVLKSWFIGPDGTFKSSGLLPLAKESEIFVDHCWLPPMIAGLTHKVIYLQDHYHHYHHHHHHYHHHLYHHYHHHHQMVAITDPESAPGMAGVSQTDGFSGIYMYICVCIYVYLCMYLCTIFNVCMYVHVFVYMHVYI